MKPNPRIRWFLSLTTFLAGLAPLTAAGEEPEGIDPEAYRHLAKSVAGRSRALVFTGLGRQEIRNPTVTPAGLVHREGSHGPTRTIPWNEVTKVEVRKSNVGTGALVGGSILGAAGLGLGLSATKECTGSFLDLTPCGASTGDVMAVTLIGFGAGALLGSLIGSMVVNWKPVYERSPSSPALGFSALSGGGAAVTVSVPL
jgi:hypothetical protein